jgi:hypothetical protein
MTSRSRRFLLLTLIGLSAVACGPAVSASPSTSAAPSSASSSAPVESTDAATPSSAAAGQSDTAWGRIWDAVPADFPVLPGAAPADDATGEPASARFSIAGGDPLAIAQWLQDALETATFSTDAMNGPGEDGGYVIDSVGDGDCRIQTRIAPLGDMTFVTVLYGADCPGP